MRHCILLIVALFVCSNLWSQGTGADKIRRVQELYAYGRYQDAQALLAGDRQLSRFDKEGRFLLALCHYQLNQLDQSALLLTELIEKEKTPYPECWLFLGKIYHARHQFEKGAEYYKAYLKLIGNDPAKRRLIWDEIERCALGLSMQFKEQRVFAENLGATINTPYDEFAPVASPSRNDRLYFSSARPGSNGGLRNAAGQIDEQFGHYRSDMYSAKLNRGTWGAVEPLSFLLNSPRHDILLDIKGDGSVLYYFNGDEQEAAIRVDTFKQGTERLLTSDPFPGPIYPALGDQFPHFVNDTLVFFASTRTGGFGGTDLYKTSFRNGYWTSPQNLGPDINTPYNETTPFQARDMITLFYSTDNPTLSIGKLDVVKATYVKSLNRWAPPKNLGMPINSAGDELNFRLTKDGFSGFLASSRKDGFGLKDIYAIYFQDFIEEMEPPPLIASTKPSPANSATPTPVSTTPSNLPVPKEENTIIENIQPPVISVPEETKIINKDPISPPPIIAETPRIHPILVEDGSTLDTDAHLILDLIAEKMLEEKALRLVITAYSNQQLNPMQQLTEGINLAEEVASYLFKKGILSSSVFLRSGLADLSHAPNYGRVVAFNFTKPELVSDVTLENPWVMLSQHKFQRELFYKVQVAASKKNNVRITVLEEYSDPMIEKYPDFDYYRFTVGGFNTYRSTNQFRQQLLQYGQKSAFVIPYLHGWRLERKGATQYAEQYPDLNNFLGKKR